MTEFTGKLKSIIFESADSLFKILVVEIQGELADYADDEIKVTGNFGDLEEDGDYRFSGQLVEHPKYGTQFQADSCTRVLPSESGGVEKYLASDKFPGIGKKAAEKIVQALGPNALKLLQSDPAKIDQLGLKPKQKQSLLNGLRDTDNLSEMLVELANWGINKRTAGQLYKKYHEQALSKLQEDPYAPLGDVSGYSFKAADRLAQHFGIAPNSPKRAQGAVIEVLSLALTREGDTYVLLDKLVQDAVSLLQVEDYDLVAEAVNALQEQGKVVVQENRAALGSAFKVEAEITEELERVSQPLKNAYSARAVDRAIAHAEASLGITYDEEQKQAVKNAVTQPLSILTGGPGSGKTTIIDGILLALKELADLDEEEAEEDFLLAAPTGRAAKRMSEVTGYEAKTIHRLIGLGIDGTELDDLKELEGAILIIDEMSMVDIYLFKKLLSCISYVSHIVLVGDKDQLPSVGAGNVFSDLIACQHFPTAKLTVVHRQKDGSTIIPLAHAVNEGKDDQLLFQKTKSYSFIKCPPSQAASVVGQIAAAALKSGFPADDIQVLGAMYRGDAGINRLNDVLQEVLNPPQAKSKLLQVHDEVFRAGDRILQLQNDPEKGIFNGQIGKVIAVNPEDKEERLLANFDGKELAFAPNDLNNLTRAYAVTIHKSQGSEFPLVILCLTMQNFIMLKRNLLYTAITRASSKLVMVGDPRAFSQAMKQEGNQRQTSLVYLLREKFGEPAEEKAAAPISEAAKAEPAEEKAAAYLTPELIHSGMISPMIGMEELTAGCEHLQEVIAKRGQ